MVGSYNAKDVFTRFWVEFWPFLSFCPIRELLDRALRRRHAQPVHKNRYLEMFMPFMKKLGPRTFSHDPGNQSQLSLTGEVLWRLSVVMVGSMGATVCDRWFDRGRKKPLDRGPDHTFFGYNEEGEESPSDGRPRDGNRMGPRWATPAASPPPGWRGLGMQGPSPACLGWVWGCPRCARYVKFSLWGPWPMVRTRGCSAVQGSARTPLRGTRASQGGGGGHAALLRPGPRPKQQATPSHFDHPHTPTHPCSTHTTRPHTGLCACMPRGLLGFARGATEEWPSDDEGEAGKRRKEAVEDACCHCPFTHPPYPCAQRRPSWRSAGCACLCACWWRSAGTWCAGS